MMSTYRKNVMSLAILALCFCLTGAWPSCFAADDWRLLQDAMEYADRGDMEQALDAVNESIFMRETAYYYHHYIRASIYKEMGQYEQAIGDCNVVIGMHPQWEPAYRLRAEVKRLSGDTAGAETDEAAAEALGGNGYDPVIAMLEQDIQGFDPGDVGKLAYAHLLKANRYYARFDYEGVVTSFAMAHALSPTMLGSSDYQIWTGSYRELERYDEAVQAMSYGLARFPDDEILYNSLANVYRLMGDTDGYRECLAQMTRIDNERYMAEVERYTAILATEPDNEHARRRRMSYYRDLEMWPEMLADVNYLLELKPDDPGLLDLQDTVEGTIEWEEKIASGEVEPVFAPTE